jgi:hypothetical protein
MTKFHDSSSRSLARSSSVEARRAETKPPAQPEGAIAGELAYDPLSDVLRNVRLTGALFFLWHVCAPYTTPVPAGRTFAPIVLPGAQQIVSYHIVTRGSCWGSLIGGPAARLEAGDILLIPHGDPYVVASSAQLCSGAEVNVEGALGFFRRITPASCPS